VVSTINATNGSQPLPDTEIILQTGSKEEKIKSDAIGRFPPVIHPADRTAVQIKVMNPKTKKPERIATIQGESGKDFNLLAKFRKWKGIAGSEKMNSSTPGQTSSTNYVVQPGDSLGKIAKLYHTSVALIKNNNGLSNDNIYPGEVLLIHGEKKEKASNAPAVKAIELPKSTSSEISMASRKKRQRVVTVPVPPTPSSTQSSDSERSKEGTGKVLALINLLPGRAPWMPIAIAEAKLRGGEVELTLQDKINYHVEIDDGMKSLYGTNNAWCAAFVNWCLLQAKYPIENMGYPGHKVAKTRAHGFYEVSGPKEKSEMTTPTVRNPLFVELDKPIYGAIAMVTSKSNHGHHVGFVYAKTGSEDLILLGGNQNQRINFSPFGTSIHRAYSEKDKSGKIIRHEGSSDKLKFFIPTAYYEQAKKDLADPGLEEMNADELNKGMGIKNEKPKKNAPISLR
jgi:uncharacterized protein (TIGR02594 family)